MEGIFKNKYRILSARLSGWDYSSSAYYFVTICTHQRIEYFGEVLVDNDGAASVALSEIGRVAERCWMDMPKYHPYVVLDEYIVMPNHVHGIVQIDKSKNVETPYLASHKPHQTPTSHGAHKPPRIASQTLNKTSISTGRAETPGMASLQGDGKWRPNKFGPQLHNMASIIRGYKSGVTMHARNHNIDFQWQPRFYDHIIRDEQALYKIREYIKKNPQMWYRDRNNSEGLLM